MRKQVAVVLLCLLAVCATAAAQQTNPAIHIKRSNGPISVDGNLDDAGWKDAVRIDTWYETNPGDNVEPKVKSVAYLTYDEHFLYAGFDFADPDPRKIGAPYGDRDNISGNSDDYAGVILDTRNDGKTGILFLANPRGIQYDAVSDDTTGNEDSSPDFYWDSAARINDHGWTLEIRIPFSSLRYDKKDPEAWGILLYRNMPRDRRYQMFANKIPRGINCFICNRSLLVGLENLPPGGHLVAAPYLTAKAVGETRDGLGSPIVTRPVSADVGGDLKWTPSADHAIDATINPDFSQVESDVAAISTNQRFAIFFPEKRPFFLEGVELFSTPIQAVYTRTITSPRWGLRSTGKFGQNAYTLLIAQDRGGGSVILPSPYGSDFADQNFSSTDAIFRVRHDLGQSFISFLGTTRESEGGAHNRVFGPDFQWKTEKNTLTGQLLFSDSRTPDHPELASEWTGQKLRSHAGYLWYQRSSRTFDFYSEYKDYGDNFRADNGFVPQVGYRANYTEAGRTFWPEKKFISRLRTFAMAEYDSTQDGHMLYRLLSTGFGGDAKYRSNFRFRYAYENILNAGQVFQRHQLLYSGGFSVNKLLSNIGISGWVGQDVDFANNRLGKGANVSLAGTLRPTEHLDMRLSSTVQWLNVRPANVDPGRLFTSQVERIRATYTFNNRMFLRAIAQNQRTSRNRDLYTFNVRPRGGSLGSQLLLAYKINWQTLMYAGYSDLRGVTSDRGQFEPNNRQLFLKVSYAFQR